MALKIVEGLIEGFIERKEKAGEKKSIKNLLPMIIKKHYSRIAKEAIK
ncbi:hypothetical protein ES705_05004 [subsurface metagenome]